MDITLTPSVLCGALDAIPSKSHAHRLIICASLGDAPCSVICPHTSRDIEATVCCMRALGAEITRTQDGYDIIPMPRCKKDATLFVGESGSTLRFLLPICAAAGGRFEFVMEGRLPARPLSPLNTVLSENGMTLSEAGVSPLIMEGELLARELSISGNVSSQYISGLMFAFAYLGDGGKTALSTLPESRGYIDMTAKALERFGVCVTEEEEDGLPVFRVSGRIKTLCRIQKCEGDWSNAAFWLCAGAIGSAPVGVRGLDPGSLQPDRAIIDILSRFGAEIECEGDKFVVSPAPLHGIEIDVKNTPDLVPILAVVAACAEGKTKITGAGRLRLKESDRIAAVCDMINSIGGEAECEEDRIIIHGTGISGGRVKSWGDHRIAMAAAIASAASADDITVIGAECTEKSYPAFFEDMKKVMI